MLISLFYEKITNFDFYRSVLFRFEALNFEILTLICVFLVDYSIVYKSKTRKRPVNIIEFIIEPTDIVRLLQNYSSLDHIDFFEIIRQSLFPDFEKRLRNCVENPEKKTKNERNSISKKRIPNPLANIQ